MKSRKINLKNHCRQLLAFGFGLQSIFTMGVAVAEVPVVNKANGEQLYLESININQAEAPLLASILKGVGIAKAEAIVEYRDSHGYFDSIESIKNVPGIGDSIVNLNRDIIVIDIK